ncbi:hypothetical protein IFM62136_10448 [Aspergillus lentulus]|nr:hypothetical protein IFM62136_10448 [Aspergillus lentulus]
MNEKPAVHYGSLPTVSLAKLIDGDAGTVNELTSACREIGFFYLDLRNVRTNNILEDVDRIFSITDDLFRLPFEKKQEYSTEKFTVSKILGYKPAGLTMGPYGGKKDGFESFMIPNNALFDLDPNMPMTAPEPLTSKRDLLEHFVGDVHEQGLLILSTLSRALQLPVDLKDCHRKCELSTTGLGLLKYLPYGSSDANIGHIAHTDLGSLAIVFSNTGGLQVFMPGLEDWRYIAPKPGHAIVNTKFSLVYLMRPEYDTVFTTSDGKEWRSLDWHNRKFTVLRATHLVQSQDSVLAGRHGFIGLADTPGMTKP